MLMRNAIASPVQKTVRACKRLRVFKYVLHSACWPAHFMRRRILHNRAVLRMCQTIATRVHSWPRLATYVSALCAECPTSSSEAAAVKKCTSSSGSNRAVNAVWDADVPHMRVVFVFTCAV